VPLTFQGETVGRLAISPAAAGEELDERGRRLVEQLARQAGPAVYGVRLTRELQRSREAIVTAREEERRRIRRDLHDGLGPQLAGIALQLSAAANGADDPRVAALARDIEEQTQGAIADVRRLVENLRPPQLDEFGLAGAIRSQADRFRDELEVSVDAPAPLRPLPAAVEVAAYRIATEALTNAARHAGARHCAIALRLDGALEVEVRDDGRGLAPAHRTGIGLVSMRERAAELGGTCVVEPVPGGGTRILATLPIPTGAAA
jgi:signal transduction histidine kinase